MSEFSSITIHTLVCVEMAWLFMITSAILFLFHKVVKQLSFRIHDFIRQLKVTTLIQNIFNLCHHQKMLTIQGSGKPKINRSSLFIVCEILYETLYTINLSLRSQIYLGGAIRGIVTLNPTVVFDQDSSICSGLGCCNHSFRVPILIPPTLSGETSCK